MMLSSCAAFKRAFSADNGKSNISVEELCQDYKPAGTLEAVFHPCSVEGPSKRRMMVYLPEGYYSSEKRYPTVYLIHGARGNETSWIVEGKMLSIVDSLTREGLVQPAIYVMPNMNQYTTEEEGLNSTFKTPIKAFLDTDGAVESAFIHDVVEFIDARYRTIPEKNYRAIAGLSVGSFQTVYITVRNPDHFGYVGLFSPIFKSPVSQGKYKEFYNRMTFYEDAKIQFDKEHCPDIYIIYIGKTDIFFFHSEYIRQHLELNNYRHDFIITKGGHNWDNWQNYLAKFLEKTSDRIFINKIKQ